MSVSKSLPFFTLSAFRSNFLNLEQLVLLGGPDDEIIGPWQSRYMYIFKVSTWSALYRSDKVYLVYTVSLIFCC